MLKRLSIAIVTLNEQRHIARVKDAIDHLKRPPGVTVETILVDGGSSDGTADEAHRVGFDRVLVQPGASIPVCRNLGIRAASGDWIAFLDGDCVPADDWLECAHIFLHQSDAALLGWPARPPEPMTWVQSAWTFHWLNKNPSFEKLHGRQVVLREGFRLATTRNMLFHRSVAEKLGGFNEELATGEDTDFAYRAYLAGIQVIGVPDLRVEHHGEPATLRQFYKQQLWHANRKSYEHIRKLSGGKVGGNAPRFTALFISTFALFIVGLVGAAVTRNGLLLLLGLPMVGLIALPALKISLSGRSLRHFPALCVLYAAYGWARSIDMVGLHRAKPSWKRVKTPSA